MHWERDFKAAIAHWTGGISPISVSAYWILASLWLPAQVGCYTRDIPCFPSASVSVVTSPKYRNRLLGLRNACPNSSYWSSSLNLSIEPHNFASTHNLKRWTTLPNLSDRPWMAARICSWVSFRWPAGCETWAWCWVGHFFFFFFFGMSSAYMPVLPGTSLWGTSSFTYLGRQRLHCSSTDTLLHPSGSLLSILSRKRVIPKCLGHSQWSSKQSMTLHSPFHSFPCYISQIENKLQPTATGSWLSETHRQAAHSWPQ